MTSDTVDFLMSQKDGANYVVLYQMLCLKTINTEGRFSRTIGEIVIPYDMQKIQRDCKWFSLDTIRVALELYKRFGLVYEEQDGTLVITDHHNLVGSETDYAEQKRNQIKSKGGKKKLSAGAATESGVETGVETGVEIFHTDIRDKILDNREKETTLTCSKEKPHSRFTPPTLEEVREYCQKRGNKISPEYFMDKMQSVGWVDKNGNKLKDWKATIRTWERYDTQKPYASKHTKTVSAQAYEQRSYTEDELLSVSGDLLEEARKQSKKGE